MEPSTLISISSWNGGHYGSTPRDCGKPAALGARIGTIANPSDLVTANAARLDSFWLEQLFFQNKLRIRAGQLAGLDFNGNQE